MRILFIILLSYLFSFSAQSAVSLTKILEDANQYTVKIQNSIEKNSPKKVNSYKTIPNKHQTMID